ncbi:unnamed protein product [Cochlearia groenlandica]
MGTSPVEDSTLSLPFEKTSPCWEFLESMEIFKVVQQRPHFILLLECNEDSRERVLERQAALLNEGKVTLGKDIAMDQSRAADLNQKVANIEQEFQATVSAPWS